MAFLTEEQLVMKTRRRSLWQTRDAYLVMPSLGKEVISVDCNIPWLLSQNNKQFIHMGYLDLS
jgi:hypothetical protein